jgi:hypothetical protein
MPQTQECPGCKARLRIADGVASRTVTCPRCLAEVPNPGAGQPVPVAEPVTEATRPCPRCKKPILPHYYFCPNCNAPLFGRGGSNVPADEIVENDIRRDTGSISVMLAVLAVLGVMGVLSFGLPLLGGAMQGRAGAIMPLLTGIAVLIAVGGLSLIFGGRRFAAENVLRLLAVVGGLFAGAIVLALALFVFLFVVCLAGSRGGAHW